MTKKMKKREARYAKMPSAPAYVEFEIQIVNSRSGAAPPMRPVRLVVAVPDDAARALDRGDPLLEHVRMINVAIPGRLRSRARTRPR